MISRNCERNALLELRGEEGAGERDRVHGFARQEGSEIGSQHVNTQYFALTSKSQDQ